MLAQKMRNRRRKDVLHNSLIGLSAFLGIPLFMKTAYLKILFIKVFFHPKTNMPILHISCDIFIIHGLFKGFVAFHLLFLAI